MLWDIVNSLLVNYVLVIVAFAWFAAQVIKVFYYWIVDKEFDILHFFEAGGMPSAHSATVSALTIAVGLVYGWDSPLFAISVVLALIVMYDATGVRREAGRQALLLNKMVEEIYASDGDKIKKLKELIGHTPLEVIVGATIGVVIAFVSYYIIHSVLFFV
ncbi:MAG: divergent PAP2 family protein [Candidatus Margulisbacteria bacterium]|nr:divergent PAP2 family protein [Candidatus Margulisiibacteriota bacterium]MBU1021123.1 divergent PAP2 family protein [Candidatus Margulisiibacteriota bacterium]MBU1728678.1 divergent PAP2 family protein [Candidatus Margulisiibacteriota bacterium]MBU1955129.1 divergent PAP2 family protein [Candidatus Margulisiibacteriota bacterium]